MILIGVYGTVIMNQRSKGLSDEQVNGMSAEMKNHV
jgi:hypothetical protein